MPFNRYKLEIEQELKAVIGDSDTHYYQMMRYHQGWIDEHGTVQSGDTGKLLRPALCIIACRAVGGNYKNVLPAAAVLELVHNFSLIHDDIEDQSHFRRHRRTVWSLWGQAQAINVGDGLYALSRLGLRRLKDNGYPADKVLIAMQLLDHACLTLCEGQYLDMGFESKTDVGVEQYLEMIGKKTAALISCAIKTGSFLGCDDDAQCNSMEQFGWNLGMAFQVRDDILGIWGFEDKTGKSASDIYQKKKSLPVIHGLVSASKDDVATIKDIYEKPTIDDQDADTVTAILDRCGARDYCENLATDYLNKAIAILDSLSLDSAAKDDLRQIAQFLIRRDY